MFALLGTRRFAPLFAVQFLGAFNDNLFRFGLLFLVTYSLLANDPARAAELVTLAGGLFVLPVALFSGLAGQVADAVCKARAIRWVKFAEILIMAAGVLAILANSIPAMFAVLFAMGLQSTFFGPLKYAIIPQHLRFAEIAGATALIEAGTYVAILSGQLSGGLVTRPLLVGGVLVVAVLGFLTSRAIPPAPPARAVQPIDWNPLTSSWTVLKHLRASRVLWLAALVGSWFWLLGIVFTTLFIPLVRGTLGGTEGVANIFVAAFSVGVALGSLLIGRWLRERVSAAPVPWALGIMTIAAVDLYFAIGGFLPLSLDLPAVAPPRLVTSATFLQGTGGIRILVDLMVFALAGGALIVPIYAVLMAHSALEDRAQIIAAYNILNSSAMVVGALGATALLTQGLSVREVLVLFSLGNLPVVFLALALVRAARRHPVAVTEGDSGGSG